MKFMIFIFVKINILTRIFLNIFIILGIPAAGRNFWEIYRKNIFWKSWKNFQSSRSKQNFTADRMEALSASENHSKAYLLSKHLFFPWFSANRLYRFWWYFQVFGYYWNRFFPSILVRKPRLSMNKCRDQHGDGWFLEEHPSSGCVQSFKRIGDREPSPTKFLYFC